MMTFILVVHSITCVLLVLTVLMQAGRGGGLTESFSSAENVFGAQTSAFMVRATSILATIFFVTSLSLAFMSARQERSLMANKKGIAKTSASASKVQSEEPLDKVSEEAVTMNAAAMPLDDVSVPNLDSQTAPAAANAQQ
jgi:preprotein translocase subunit SecG